MTVLSLTLAGILATALSDLWQRAFMTMLGQKAPRWGSVGRWVMGMGEGRIIDHALSTRPARSGEEAAGWAVHYVVGILYAWIYALLLHWLDLPSSFALVMIYALLTLAAPMLFMKPAMGGGLFGWRAARPWLGFTKTLSAHLSYGVGLWLALIVA